MLEMITLVLQTRVTWNVDRTRCEFWGSEGSRKMESSFRSFIPRT